tara:strand:- start:85 stop:570 length:486 start_codon:yes stop_codon:yes gene_type:complete
MGATHLSDRSNWQKGARIVGDAGENDFIYHLRPLLPSSYVIRHKPEKLVIYSSNKGIKLDSKIVNTETGKCLFIEKKTGNNGGNAHERVYKFMSPSLKRKIIKEHNAVDQPFFLVFSGKTFQGQKYQDELELLLEEENYIIMEQGFSNIAEAASKITEVLG